MADITPRTSVIEALRKQSLSWAIILGELIDNAFDADAKRVSILFDGKQLTVEDDGNGCSDPLLFITLGDRKQSATSKLGRYGIGAKDALISAANAAYISSTQSGVRRTVDVNWSELEYANTWTIRDPVEAPTDDPNGTRLILKPLRTTGLKSEQSQSLINRLQLIYTPAICQGRQIIFKSNAKSSPKPIPEFLLPPLEHQMTAELAAGSKTARVTMGIIPEGIPAKETGLFITYGYRVIIPGSRIGLGNDPTPGLFGWVELKDGWSLSKNKDHILGGLDELGAQILRACFATIEEARRRSQNIQLECLSDELSRHLAKLQSDGPRRRKAKRQSPESETGTILPRATGRKHRRASRSQTGDTFIESTDFSRGIQVSLEHMGEEGPFCRIQGEILYLNSDIPSIREAAKDTRTVTPHAVHALATYLATRPGDQQLSFARDLETEFARYAEYARRLLLCVDTSSPVLSEAV